MTDLAEVLEELLQVDEGASVLFGETFADGDVLVHACAHEVLAVRLNVVGGEQEDALDTILDGEDHFLDVLLILLEGHRPIGEGGNVKLTPHVIYTD